MFFVCFPVESVSKSSAARKAVSTQVGGQLTDPSATVQGGEGGSGFGEQRKWQCKETYGTIMEQLWNHILQNVIQLNYSHSTKIKY